MKRFFFLGLVFAVIVACAGEGKPKGINQDTSVPRREHGLELTLISPKRSYKPSDQFKLQVMLRNTDEKALFVFGTLEWGYSASLMFHIRDASGKKVEPILIPDPPPHAPPEDQSDFVKLQPDNFLGTSYFAPLKLMNLTKPGKYSIFVEYWCPFSSMDVSVSPFWGSDNGKIKSNIVWIQVVR
jgi:hypothetical protein